MHPRAPGRGALLVELVPIELVCSSVLRKLTGTGFCRLLFCAAVGAQAPSPSTYVYGLQTARSSAVSGAASGETTPSRSHGYRVRFRYQSTCYSSMT
jgi:hypothetical protein